MKTHILTTILLCFIFCTYSRAQGPVLYGMTIQGGDLQAQGGNIFQYPLGQGLFKSVHDFGVTGTDGSSPWGSLVLADNGLLYGMTKSGGAHFVGTLFSFNPVNDTVIIWHSFSISPTDGAAPYGSLIQAGNGWLYGMTTSGGANGTGAIIGFNPVDDSLHLLYSFAADTSDGNYPYGSLVQADDGTVYGMTERGGAHDSGTIFSFDITTGNEVKLHDLGHGTDAAYPWGALLPVGNVLYGMSTAGGANGLGALFSYNVTTQTDSVLHSFSTDSLDGSHAYGSLIQGTDGLLYGLAEGGGRNRSGLLFSYNMATGAFTDLHDFGSINQDGVRPEGTLLQASDGKLYGMTTAGGSITDGVVFTYNLADSSYSVLDFTGPNGYLPYFGALVEYNASSTGIKPVEENSSIVVFPNPTSGQFTIKSSGNLTGCSVGVYNILGELIYTSIINNDTWPVDLSGNAKGIYFYKITGANSLISQGKICME